MPLSLKEIPTTQLIRSDRRSISLEIKSDGMLIIRAPLSTKDSVIQKFVDEKRDWIQKSYAHTLKRLEQFRPKQFIEGEKFLYLGQEYDLHIADDMFGKLLFEDRFILSARYLPKARRLFEQWYKEEAFAIFTRRCKFYSPILKASYQSIKLSSAKHRWGSCHPRGSLCFNWRLVMAPEAIIDYVVVHELAHIKEANHSSRFWAIVSQTLPGYKEAKKWLKENHFKLYF